MKTSISATPTNNPSVDYPEAWLNAREIVNDLGDFPVTFTTPIRTLIHDETKGTTSAAGQFLTTRLLRSPTVKAMFYYSSLTYFGDRMANSAYLSSSDLVRLYQPKDCAAILATIYLLRRLLKKQADTLEGWERSISSVNLRSELGGHVGIAIPSIGMTRGIFTGALRELSIVAMGRRHRNNYLRYIDHLDASKLRYCYEYEVEHWGCRHVDIAGNVLQMMGFGIEEAYAFINGLGDKPPSAPEVNQPAFEYQLMERWIEALLTTKTLPDETHLGQYYPKEKEKHRLLYEVNHMAENGSKHLWLQRKKEDINPQSTPQLFQEFLQELEQNSSIQDFYQENLPSDVLDELSEEDLAQLSSNKNTDLD